jgi:hypothetical protein
MLPHLPLRPLDPPVPVRYDPDNDVLGHIFADSMIHDSPTFGLTWLFATDSAMEKSVHNNDGHAAMTTALYAIARLQIQVVALAVALQSARKALGKPVALKELKRRSGKRIADISRKADAAEKIRLARELFAEYDPADVKGYAKRVYREIGEVMAKRLKLAKVIPGGTVRKYISQKKSGNG